MSLPNTPSSRARTCTFFAIVNSLRNEPSQSGFGSPMTLLSESLHVPRLMRLALRERRPHVHRLIAAAVAA